jgi:hypothetical protein
LRKSNYLAATLIALLANPVYAGDSADSVSSSAPPAAHRRYELNATSNSFDLGAEESVLAWEKWHHQVGKLLAKHMSHAVGTLLGTAELRITIDKDQKVTVELLKSTGNKEFGEKCLEGARSVDKDADLKYPEGSKRTEVTFHIVFKRTFFTIPGLHYIRNDYERLSE